MRLQVSHLGGTAPFLAHRLASLEAREPERAARAPAGALGDLRRLYYDTGLSNYELPSRPTLEPAGVERIGFGAEWPDAGPPPGGGPAPGRGARRGGGRAPPHP